MSEPVDTPKPYLDISKRTNVNREYDGSYSPNNPPKGITRKDFGETELEAHILNLDAAGCYYEIRDGMVIKVYCP